MSDLFKVHLLNEQGKAKAKAIATAFDGLIEQLADAGVCVRDDGPKSRCGAIVRTKLEEAAFYAKKDMANSPENSEP